MTDLSRTRQLSGFDTFCHGDAKSSHRVSNVAGRNDAVAGRVPNVTELEWSGEVVEYNVVNRGLILSERSIAVTLSWAHTFMIQPNKINSIVYGRSENLTNRQGT